MEAAVAADEQQRALERSSGRCTCGGRRRPEGGRPCGCVSVPDDDVQRPDLGIYSQDEVIAAGGTPSWDNPDIVTNSWGPFRLNDEANVKVRNVSVVPASNVLVHYYTSPFGIGMQQTLLQTRRLDLPGGAEVTLNFPLDHMTKAGDPRIGVHIVIEHPHDGIQINNRGAQVHDGSYSSESGRTHTITVPVLNASNFPRSMTFDALPGPLGVALSASSHSFAPWEQIAVQMTVTVPSSIPGSPGSPPQHGATFVARSGGELIGGVTKLVRVDA